MTKIAINGFGRIGRGFLRAAQARKEFEVVAINDLASAENLAYLLKYDTVYGRATFPVAVADGGLLVNGKKITLSAEREPTKLPWKEHTIDIVIEATGLFTDGEKAKVHLEAGAKHVVISAPGKGEGVETILVGGNYDKFATCG